VSLVFLHPLHGHLNGDPPETPTRQGRYQPIPVTSCERIKKCFLFEFDNGLLRES